TGSTVSPDRGSQQVFIVQAVIQSSEERVEPVAGSSARHIVLTAVPALQLVGTGYVGKEIGSLGIHVPVVEFFKGDPAQQSKMMGFPVGLVVLRQEFRQP